MDFKLQFFDFAILLDSFFSILFVSLLFVGAGLALEDAIGGAELLNWWWAYEEQADDDTVAAGDVRDTALGNDAVVVEGDRENGRTYTVNELTATFDVKVNVTQID